MLQRIFPSAFVIGVLLIFAGDVAVAQEPDGEQKLVELIQLSSVSAVKKGDKWLIKAKGVARKVPKGAIIELTLNRSYVRLEKFRFELDKDSRKFDVEFESTRINGEVDKLYLSASIPFAEQPKAVKKKIENKPEEFPMEQAPWRVGFAGKSFMAGSKSDLARRQKEIQKFFVDSIKEAVSLNSRFERYRKEAEGKTRFVKGENLDTEKWLKSVEGDIREPLRELQKKILEAQKNISYIDCTRDVGYLHELAASVAKRSYDRSLSLQQKFGQTPHPDDKPKDIEVGTKKKPTKKNMGRLVERICDSRGIDMKELQ